MWIAREYVLPRYSTVLYPPPKNFYTSQNKFLATPLKSMRPADVDLIKTRNFPTDKIESPRWMLFLRHHISGRCRRRAVQRLTFKGGGRRRDVPRTGSRPSRFAQRPASERDEFVWSRGIDASVAAVERARARIASSYKTAMFWQIYAYNYNRRVSVPRTFSFK